MAAIISRQPSLMILLDELERIMRQHGLWSTTGVSKQSLHSTMPFACDTLNFEQWLQHIFIPTMSHILKKQAALPNKCGLLPAAQELMPIPVPALLSLLGQIDDCLNESQ